MRYAHTMRRAPTRYRSNTSNKPAYWRADLDNAFDVTEAGESDITPKLRQVAAKKFISTPQAPRRFHGYLPPKKFPVGGEAAIGLTRLRWHSLRKSAAAAIQCRWPVEPTQKLSRTINSCVFFTTNRHVSRFKSIAVEQIRANFCGRPPKSIVLPISHPVSARPSRQRQLRPTRQQLVSVSSERDKRGASGVLAVRL